MSEEHVNRATARRIGDRFAYLDGDGAITILDLTIASNEFGRSCASTGANTGEGRYTYNGNGLRIRERTYPNAAPFVTRDFTWDQGSSLPNILQETRTLNGGAAATVSYVYGHGLIAATDSAGGTSYVLSDGLGSTSQLADTTGTVTDSYTYDVFGAPRTVTGTTANDFRFTGQQDDYNANRGLYYLRARAYDPALGRFLSQDPLPFAQRYAYAGNNPANFVDPFGLCPWGVPKDVCRAASATKDVSVNGVELGRTVVHGALSLAAVPPYAVYYVSYETAQGMNWVGSQFGWPGSVLSHTAALPLVVPEAAGLAGDVAIDFVKGHTVAKESVCDEGKEGGIFPRFILGGGPKTYLPGIHHDHCSKIDFAY